MNTDQLLSLFKLLRPQHWVKNSFIFLPVFFALKMTDGQILLAALEAFISFCLLSSAVYILNDWQDVKEDINHPIKKNRPLASGKIKLTVALPVAFSLIAGSFASALNLPSDAILILGGYLVLNLGYSFGLKHIPLLDIFIISIGFLLRIFIGAVSAGISVTMWMILITFLLAMFLALSKRREDVLALIEGKTTRKSVHGYTLEFVNTGMVVLASVTIMAYISYTVSSAVISRVGTSYLYLTSLFVILGFLRYIQVVIKGQYGFNPTDILIRDRFLQLIIFFWWVLFIVLLYKPFGSEFI